MINLKEIDEAANLWNKTRSLKYKERWYKLVKEFADGRNIDNTGVVIRRDVNSRNIQFIKTDRGS